MFFSVTQLCISIEGQELFSNLSFGMEQGQKLVLSGPSGSGKTTLLSTIMGFEKPQSGRIHFQGRELNADNLSYYRQNIAWVPQEIHTDMGVGEFMMQPFGWKHNRKSKPGKKNVLDMMESFRLDKQAYKKQMQDLSGGEKQRVLLIVALLLGRKLLLLDEPTASLDHANRGIVMDRILNDASLSVLSVSHDSEWANRCGQVIDLPGLYAPI